MSTLPNAGLPTRFFVNRLALRLAGEARLSATGARSLAHILVVVPTAQSGRRLRAALARTSGAIIPPLVKTPYGVLDIDEETIATRTDEILAFHEAQEKRPDGTRPPIEIAAQLSDIRKILGANALSFADVAERIAAGDTLKGDCVDSELARWRDLAKLERSYLELLARRGRIDRVEAVKARLANPPRYAGVEKIVVAGVLDPIPLMERALKAIALPVERIDPEAPDVPPLDRAMVSASGTPASEAESIAEFFAAVKPDEALPALCVADSGMFTEIASAFRAKGLKVHNPAGTRLATSSLGHLVSMIIALIGSSSYQIFSSFIRTGDVRRWISAELRLSDEDFAAALVLLDKRQQELLPEKIDDIAPRTEGTLRAIFEFVRTKLRKCGVRELLELIFRGYYLDDRDEEAREFAAAAIEVNGLIDECFAPDVPEALRGELFTLRLAEATYSLEPDEGEVILTDGWLELPYLDSGELVIAGFQEGAVPESIVGHPFVPDSLRAALGLPNNESRGRRDLRIFSAALACREKAAVGISFHAVDSAGDVKKPSRLLFETPDDRELVSRVREFYGVRAGTREEPAADLPAVWKLHLPFPPEHKELVKTSPTRFDVYLRCPFTAYLREKSILGDKRLDDRAEELPSWEYGNIAHAALEAWGRAVLAGEFTANEDENRLAAFFDEQVDRWLVDRFGTSIPAIVAMQGESVKRRLRNFAAVQVAHYREGWRIRAAEEKLEVKIGHTLFSGKCDRIDFNELTGKWCVIDYKTWDSAEKAVPCEKARDGTTVWKSFQLPLYCSMLSVSAKPGLAGIPLEDITSAYAVLGKTRDAVLFTPPTQGALSREAEEEIRRLIPRYEAGIFWPPSLGEKAEWKWDYADWLGKDPRETVDEEWIRDQEKRLEIRDKR